MEIWNSIIGLAGVLLGSALSFIATSITESRKRKRELDDAYRAKRREALELLMRHIDPMQKAFDAYSYRASQAMFHGQTEFRSELPNLLSDLSKFDLTPAQRATLPNNLYERSIKLVSRIDNLQIYFSLTNASKEEREEYLKGVEKMMDDLEAFQKLLNEQYRKTFE